MWGTGTRLPGRGTVEGSENEAEWTAVEWAGPKFDYTEQKQCCSFKADMTTQSVNPRYREPTPQPGCLDPYLTVESQLLDLGVGAITEGFFEHKASFGSPQLHPHSTSFHIFRFSGICGSRTAKMEIARATTLSFTAALQKAVDDVTETTQRLTCDNAPTTVCLNPVTSVGEQWVTSRREERGGVRVKDGDKEEDVKGEGRRGENVWCSQVEHLTDPII
ncbi:hypothetical protein GBF38_001702 [Nibea albiflora]|uniref:Uncharacterized protein n=1 Tax=Nibea albiflora TaxID=240163 RepID=A0ACB7EUB6_NIBAL|nr:hypothetical protein GBF38_001702 [Nibea albiflora]